MDHHPGDDMDGIKAWLKAPETVSRGLLVLLGLTGVLLGVWLS